MIKAKLIIENHTRDFFYEGDEGVGRRIEGIEGIKYKEL